MDGLSIPGAIVASGVAAVWTALGVNKSRKRDADKDGDQRKQIADAQLDVASRQADSESAYRASSSHRSAVAARRGRLRTRQPGRSETGPRRGRRRGNCQDYRPGLSL